MLYRNANKLPLCFGELQDTTEGMGAACSFVTRNADKTGYN